MYQKHLSRYLKPSLANQEYLKVPKVHKNKCKFFLSYLLEISHYHFQPPRAPQKKMAQNMAEKMAQNINCYGILIFLVKIRPGGH